MKHSDPVFWLSRNGKYLELYEYAENSKTCLGTAKSVKNLTMSDLRGAISEKVGGNVVNNVEDENNVHEEQIILNNVSVMYHGYLVE